MPSQFEKKKISPAKSLTLGFLSLIILGTVLLILPASSKQSVSIIDALFTATSATCVTGLVVYDTGSHWTGFGQSVILLLIQVGGLGIMTFSTLGAYIVSGKINLRNRYLFEDSIAGGHTQNVGKLILSIIFSTLIIEAVGAVILTWRFSLDKPLLESVYLGVFHSISAFCNAGFALFSTSLSGFHTDYLLNITVILLIILGGIGFWVIFDILKLLRKKSRRLGLHSRIVLITSAILVLFGMVLFLFFEWNNVLDGRPVVQKLIDALFQSVTTRTAGFNTLPVEAMTSSTLLLFIMLMLVGASPGSCGGGVKTTTFAVVSAMIFSRFRNEPQVRLLNRGVSERVVSKAIAIVFFAMVIVIVAITVLLVTEHPGGPHMMGRTLFLEVVFEVFSAFGTVGLSMGLTPVLSFTGKIVIILLMFIGRVGPLTIALAIVQRKNARFKYAEEELWVG